MTAPSDSDSVRQPQPNEADFSLAECIEECIGRLQRGESTDLEDYARRYPLLADRLRSMERELTDLKMRVDHKARQFSLLLDKAIE